MSRKEDHHLVSGSNLPGLATNLGPESRWPSLGGSYDKAVTSAANERDTISFPYRVGTSVSVFGADDQEWEQNDPLACLEKSASSTTSSRS